MLLSALRHIALAAAFMAMLTQSFGVNVLRLTQGVGFQNSYLICSPSGKALSPEHTKAVQALAELLGEAQAEAPVEDTNYQHCSECIFAAATTHKNTAFGIPLHYDLISSLRFRFTPERFAHQPHGPPLGGRAPPRLT